MSAIIYKNTAIPVDRSCTLKLVTINRTTGAISPLYTANYVIPVIVSSSGGVLLSGSASISRGAAAAGAGGVVPGGAVTAVRGTGAVAAGGAVSGGAVTAMRSVVVKSSGGIVPGGAATASGTTATASVSVASVGGAVLSGAAGVVGTAAAVASGPVTLSFESATITDNYGQTWEKVIPTAVDQGAVGVITSGVSGVSGADGNCLLIKQSVFDNGYETYSLDTFIRRTMNVAAGTLSIRVRRGHSSIAGTAYVKIGSTKYDLGVTTLNAFVDKTVTIPVAQTDVIVEIGFQIGSVYTDSYIDSVSIPQ